MKKLLLPIAFLTLTAANAQQGVAITPNGAAPDPSAMLEVTNPNKGVLLTRVDLTATNIAAPVVAPVNSLLVFNNNTNGAGATAVTPGFYYWSGPTNEWVRMVAGNGVIGTDDQNLTSATLVGNLLTVNIENGTPVSVNLSGLITSSNAYNTTFAINGSNLDLTDGGGTLSIPLADIINAIDAYNQTFVVNGGNLELTDGGGTLQVPLTDINANDWHTNGNAGTTPATNFLGTTDNQDLVVRTNNTEKVRVLSNGNVGIGTATPAAPLEVWGPAIPLAIVSTNSNAAKVILSDNGVSRGYIGADATRQFFTGDGASVDQQFNILQNGNVGIKTTSPASELHIVGAGNNGNALFIEDGTQIGIGGEGIVTGVNTGYYKTTGSFGINVNAPTGVSDPASYDMYIDRLTKNIGINTTVPTHRLHVSENSGTTVTMLLENSTANSGLVFKSLGTSPATPPTIFGSGNDLRFFTGGNGRMQILNNGNVGIGTGLTSGSVTDVLTLFDPIIGESGLTFTSMLNAPVLKTNGTGEVVAATALNSVNNGVFWGLEGNTGTNPATNFLGTADNQILNFRTNNLQRMQIAADGKVAIGGAPNSNVQLSVNSSAPSGMGIEYLNPSTSISTNYGLNIVNNDLTPNNYASLWFNDNTLGSGVAAIGAKVTDHTLGSKNADLEFLTAENSFGAIRMVIKDNGNVGINTLAPSGKLDVIENSGTVNARLLLNTGGTTVLERNSGSVLSVNNTTTDPGNLGQIVLQRGNGAGDDMFITTEYDGANGVEAMGFASETNMLMNILKNGNVGIGTITPTQKLEVQGTVKIVDGTQGANKVLVSDATGAASWQAIGAVVSGSAIPAVSVPITTNNTWTNTGATIILPPGTWEITSTVLAQSITGFNNGNLYCGWSDNAGVYNQAAWQSLVQVDPNHQLSGSINASVLFNNTSGVPVTLYFFTKIATDLPFDPNANINAISYGSYAKRIQ